MFHSIYNMDINDRVTCNFTFNEQLVDNEKRKDVVGKILQVAIEHARFLRAADPEVERVHSILDDIGALGS